MLKVIEVGSACITIWDGEPTVQDVDNALKAAQRLSERVQRPIALLGVLSEDVSMPSDIVRARMIHNWPLLMPLASTMQYVNLSIGFRAARIISMLVAVFALTKHGKSVGVHAREGLDRAISDVVSADSSLNSIEIKRAVTLALKEIKEAKASQS